MSWNVHGCVGTDRRRDPARVAAAIGALAPDILALQEVDTRDIHADPVPFLDLVAGEARLHRAEVFTLESPGRRYGNVLCSRWPIADVVTVDLSVSRREPRRAIDARIVTPAGPVRVLASHFGLARAERETQIGRLVERISDDCHTPTLLLGDFNDWRFPGSVGRHFGALLPVIVAPRSFPARLPLFRLDRIFASPGIRLTSALPPAEPRIASDHLSVAVDVLINARMRI